MTYAFFCVECGRSIEREFPMGKAAPQVTCFDCGHQARRDFSSIQHRNSDPFRTTWLSNRKTNERLAKQQRPLDPLAPKDMFEVRERRATHGRIYIGDDTSLLRPEARAAVEGDAGGLRADKKYDKPAPKDYEFKPSYNTLPEPVNHPLGPSQPWGPSTAKGRAAKKLLST